MRGGGNLSDDDLPQSAQLIPVSSRESAAAGWRPDKLPSPFAWTVASLNPGDVS